MHVHWYYRCSLCSHLDPGRNQEKEGHTGGLDCKGQKDRKITTYMSVVWARGISSGGWVHWGIQHEKLNLGGIFNNRRGGLKHTCSTNSEDWKTKRQSKGIGIHQCIQIEDPIPRTAVSIQSHHTNQKCLDVPVKRIVRRSFHSFSLGGGIVGTMGCIV